jgi:hypothetical protein
VHLCSTFIDLNAAKKATYSALSYPKESFSSFKSKQDYSNVHEWPYDAAIFIRAKSESGKVFTVETNYYLESSEDLAGYKRETSIEGTFRTKLATRKCAEGVLLYEGINRKDYVEFSLYGKEDSPYGSNVMLRAVASTGDNFVVSIVKINHNEEDYYSSN